ncbi:MAG: hypothetical protein ACRENL_01485 [Candidatus Dormibacteria bacterium]
MPAGRPKGRYNSNEHAARATILHLERGGTITEADALLVTDIITLAIAVDSRPTSAILRKEYREAAAELRRLHSGDDDDGTGDLVAELRAEVGNAAANGTAQPRPRGGGGDEAAGNAGHALAGHGPGRRARAFTRRFPGLPEPGRHRPPPAG